jgi:HSP20 family protein
MSYSERDKNSRKKNENLPSLSDWLNEPLSSGLNFFGRPMESFSRPFKQWWEGVTPTVDVSESEKDISVRVEVPGMNEKELDVTYSQGVLAIDGEKKVEEEHTKGQSKIRESKYGSFHREIPLGNDLIWDSAKASCKNGVLKITIPKSEKSSQFKKITVE